MLVGVVLDMGLQERGLKFCVSEVVGGKGGWENYRMREKDRLRFCLENSRRR
jgi:hypothetical protein